MQPWETFETVLRIPHESGGDIILIGEKHKNPESRLPFLEVIEAVSPSAFAIEATRDKFLNGFSSVQAARDYCAQIRGLYNVTENREFTVTAYSSFPVSATGFAILESLITESSLAFIDTEQTMDRAAMDDLGDLNQTVSVDAQGDIEQDAIDALRYRIQREHPAGFTHVFLDRERVMASFLNALRTHHSGTIVAVVGALHLVPVATRLRILPLSTTPTPRILFETPVPADEDPYDSGNGRVPFGSGS